MRCLFLFGPTKCALWWTSLQIGRLPSTAGYQLHQHNFFSRTSRGAHPKMAHEFPFVGQTYTKVPRCPQRGLLWRRDCTRNDRNIPGTPEGSILGVCVKNVWVAAVLWIVNAYWLSWMCEQQTIMSRCVLYSCVVFEYGVTTFRNSRWMNRRKRSIDIYWEITFSCFNNWGSIRSIYLIACINFGRCFK